MSKFTPTQVTIGKTLLLENCMIKSYYLVYLDKNKLFELGGTTLSSLETKWLLMNTELGKVLSPLWVTEILKDLSEEELKRYNEKLGSTGQTTTWPAWKDKTVSYLDPTGAESTITLSVEQMESLLIDSFGHYVKVLEK